jgi:hypothetical protein
VRLQSLRAVDSNATEFILRLQHNYAVGEDSELSRPVDVDLGALLKALAPDARAASPVETTLDGGQPVAAMKRRRSFPTTALGDTHANQLATERATGAAQSAGGGRGKAATPVGLKGGNEGTAAVEVVTLHPMELRTWRVRLTM